MLPLRALALLLALVLAATALQARSRGPAFPNIGYATWSDSEPAYRLYPGDEITVSFPGAPELSAQVQVGPDGRIQLPLVGPVMAADLTTAECARAIDRAYAGQLIDPDAEVEVRQAGPLKVFVGGEVAHPGVYDMVGDMDALRAIVDAGGFTNNADEGKVIVLRRGPGGRPMMRTVDLKRVMRRGGGDLVPLRRFDVVWAPRTGLASAGVFMQHLRDLIPGSLGFSYVSGNAGIAGVAP